MAVTINADNGIVSGSSGLKYTPDASGILALQTSGNTALTIDNNLNANLVGSLNSTNTFKFKNRFRNGGMLLAQRNNTATVTAGTTVPTISTGYPCVDGWFVYSTGANVVASQIAGSGTAKNRLQIAGAASVTAVGVGQRIESFNSYDLAGTTCTLSADISNNVLTTVTWTAYYANTADTFGTIGTPTKTQFATGTWTVSSTIANYNAQIAVPSAAVTGIEIIFTVGAQTSGTWVLGNIQFEKGSQSTSFEYLHITEEEARNKRYYTTSYYPGSYVGAITNTNILSRVVEATMSYASVPVFFPVTLRTNSLTFVAYSPATGTADRIRNTNAGTDLAVAYQGGANYMQIQVNNVSVVGTNQLTAHYTASAEIP